MPRASPLKIVKPGIGKLIGEFFRGFRAVEARLPRADDAHALAVARRQFAPDVQNDGRIVDRAQRRRDSAPIAR